MKISSGVSVFLLVCALRCGVGAEPVDHDPVQSTTQAYPRSGQYGRTRKS